jgi:dipeptidase E
MAHDLLLLSSSTVHGSGFLAYAMEPIRAFLEDRQEIVFVPFASHDHDSYTRQVAATLGPLGLRVGGLHTAADPGAAIRSAGAVFVGGGNTFRLLRDMDRQHLLEVIRDAVADGSVRYMGASAGSNLACPAIRTTNDMPIVQPPSFESFGLIPFQINPHYLDPDPASTHMGETREKRIEQFLEENDVPVLGMREGAWLRRRGAMLTLEGATGARLFRRAADAAEFAEGADLSFLLDLPASFDTSKSTAAVGSKA